MVLSGAEKVRRFRQRQKEAEKSEAKGPERTGHWYLKRGFSEYDDVQGERIEYEIALDVAGFDPDGFYDEADPKSGTGNVDPATYEEIKGAIGRAELTVSMLVEAATVLAGMINDFKKQEIAARIAEIEAADLNDPDKKRQALSDVVRLERYRIQLEKQVRLNLPQWKVKGE